MGIRVRHVHLGRLYSNSRRLVILVLLILNSFPIFRNEVEVGDAIKASGIPREEIWLTTKVR